MRFDEQGKSIAAIIPLRQIQLPVVDDLHDILLVAKVQENLKYT